MTSLRPLELPNSAMPARKSAKGDSTEDAHLERRDGAYDDRPCEPEPRDLSIPAVKRSNVPHVDVPLAGAADTGNQRREEACHDDDARSAEPEGGGDARN